MDYKLIEPVDPGRKKIDPAAAGVNLGLAKDDLTNMYIKLVSAKANLVVAKVDFSTINVDLVVVTVGLARIKFGRTTE